MERKDGRGSHFVAHLIEFSLFKLFRIILYFLCDSFIQQAVYFKWGPCRSDYFCISNAIRQGRILSPKLFSVYVDDLSDQLIKSKIGYHTYNLCMNYVMYADDICLMAPSPASL